MQSGGEKITEIKTYSCGSCSNNLGLVFKDMPHEKREFPARAILLKHQNDYFIFDTGYSNRVFENGIISKLYAWLNPIHYDDKQDNLANQLAQDGIYLEQIKFIVLSHLHPDHIGGLRDFPGVPILLSNQTYQDYKQARVKDLIFKNLLPDDFESRISIFDTQAGDFDLFDDGSCLLKPIPGHTLGQVGMLLPEYHLFFAVDSSWGADLLDKKMRFTGRMVQKNYQRYLSTSQMVQSMIADGIEVHFCHELEELNDD